MAEPFLSEIRLMSFVFAPVGWALCNGQLLPINQNQALFSLLGTTYGGNGQTNFALPDFRGRVPIHMGAGHTLGERAGEQAHTLTQSEMPTHAHQFQVSNAPADQASPASNEALARPRVPLFKAPQQLTSLHPSSVSNVGGSQAHLNMQPFLTLSFCIALQGIFPSQT
ncbi:phage tail protein [Aggregicoccus sp. 17bor-14]|uniref:phage tail protein n=1 Tax=Myxococcaceae TaxID=31 RepID=UPI00129D18CA|nr:MULTISPECIES: tail fiber protein [Myxococcaceae]MBF5040968.1 phage tail protein [Simulacricoccus sp. 17bor-14]MRI86756.1 phage tail protein [Aggregicoccus sp. 17bor-14]